MTYSMRVSFSGLLIGIMGAFASDDRLVMGGFILLAAGAVCKAIEGKK